MATADNTPSVKLSEDRSVLTVKRRVPGGIQTATYHRLADAGPFTDEDVAFAVAATPRPDGWQIGQRNKHRRAITRYGTLWTSLMLGPPTWWVPKVRHEKDGTLMAGWLRLAVAVRYDRSERRGNGR